MKFLLALCLVAVASGSVLRPAFPEDVPFLRPVFPEDTPVLRPVFPEEESILRPVFPEEGNLGSNFPGTGEVALPAEVAPMVQIIINIQKSAGSAPAVEVPAEVEQVPDFGPPAAIEEVPETPVIAPEFQPETPIVPLVPIVPDERPPVGLFPIIPDLNRPGVPNTGMLRPQGPVEEIAISPW